MSYVQLTACSADIQGSGDKFAYFIWLYGVITVWPDHDMAIMPHALCFVWTFGCLQKSEKYM